MTEQQAQGQSALGEDKAQRSQEQEGGERQREAYVPRDRFDDVNNKKSEAERRAREAEQRLQQMEAEREQQQEQRAQAQGEWQQVAEKRLKTIQQRDARIKELEAQIVRDRRYRAFVTGSSGLILGEALDDAFAMVSDDEWKSVDDQDPEAVRTLAQSLAERKPYLSAGQVRGAGSGGSKTPVLGHAGSPNGQQRQNTATVGGRQVMFKGNRRRPWK
jgi:hypothetical protein